MFAISSASPRDSLLRTWVKFHRAAHECVGIRTSPFPLTVRSIRLVGALFKCGGYRSFANYASRAKEAHVELMGSWEPDLEREVTLVSRSCTRGIGPSRQSAALDVAEIPDLDLPLIDPL